MEFSKLVNSDPDIYEIKESSIKGNDSVEMITHQFTDIIRNVYIRETLPHLATGSIL